MQTITFECEVITPMFLAGADGTTPELRPPSIKGALRFWWRAMNGHLPLEDRKDNNGNVLEKGMRTIEGEIFGSTTQRSRVIIREPQETVAYKHFEYDGTSESFMLPHKPEPKHDREKDLRSKNKCFPVSGSSVFSLEFSLIKDVKINLRNEQEYIFNFEQLCSLFKLVCLLGGFGKRSRRGFGSIKILRTQLRDKDWQVHSMPQTIEEIEKLIRVVSKGFSYTATSNYPTIQSIVIGNTSKSVAQIGKVTHDVKSDVDTSNYKIAYDSTLGAGRPRFASPIYISILENGKPVITTLKAISPNRREVNMNLQTELKTRIL